MRELERDQMLRASHLRCREQMAVMSDVIGRLKGVDPAASDAAAAMADQRVDRPLAA
jgi:hypothetical protein